MRVCIVPFSFMTVKEASGPYIIEQKNSLSNGGIFDLIANL